MFSEIPQIDRKAKLKDLIQQWKNSRRAFAIITNEVGENFPISARKTLENVSCPILMVDVEK